jgi:hypothetical protein
VVHAAFAVLSLSCRQPDCRAPGTALCTIPACTTRNEPRRCCKGSTQSYMHNACPLTASSRVPSANAACLQLTSGCILGQSAPIKGAPGAAASPGAAACVACSAAGPADPRWTPGHVADASSPACVRCPHGTPQQAPSAWTCIPGLPSGFETIAVRLSSTGVPECASADSRKCSRAPVGTSCGAWVAQLNAAAADAVSGAAAQPLRCGEDHQRAWGITGFDTPGHWCNLASDYFRQSGGWGAGYGNYLSSI